MYILERENVQKQVAAKEEADRLVAKGFKITAQTKESEAAPAAAPPDVAEAVRREVAAQLEDGALVDAVGEKLADVLKPPSAEEVAALVRKETGQPAPAAPAKENSGKDNGKTAKASETAAKAAAAK